MRSFLRGVLLMAPLLGLAGPAALGQPAPPPPSSGDDPDSNPVLTDRKPFCETLARKVSALQRSVTAPHAEADWLASEGTHMCAIGHVPQGIRRLRYALMELMELKDDQ